MTELKCTAHHVNACVHGFLLRLIIIKYQTGVHM